MIIILQARTGSRRFPKKILKKINGVTIIEHILNRLKYVKNIDKLVVATTNKSDDDIVKKICDKKSVLCS